MIDWMEQPLHEVAHFQEGPGILAKDFVDNGTPLVRLAGLGGYEVTLKGCNHVADEKASTKWQHFRLNQGDILVSTSASFGRPAVVGAEAEDAIFYTGIIRFRTKSKRLSDGYLKLFLGSREFILQAEAHASGSVIRHFGPSHLRQMTIRIPPIDLQREIVDLIGLLDDKIELNRRMNETLESMARAVFKDWFVDFGPTRAKMKGHSPYLAPGLWNLFPDTLDGEGKPVGWEVGTVGNLADTNLQSWTTRNHPSFVDYVDLSNAKWGNIDSISRMQWEQAPSRARRITRAGDTVVGTTRPGNGSFAYISRDGLTVSTGFAVLSPRKLAYRDFVHIAATRQENIDRLANLADGHGGAYPAVKPQEVSDTELLLPGETTLNAFAELAAPLREKVEHAKSESRSLARTRDLLLPKLMSGEIRLRDIEKVTEAVA